MVGLRFCQRSADGRFIDGSPSYLAFASLGILTARLVSVYLEFGSYRKRQGHCRKSLVLALVQELPCSWTVNLSRGRRTGGHTRL